MDLAQSLLTQNSGINPLKQQLPVQQPAAASPYAQPAQQTITQPAQAQPATQQTAQVQVTAPPLQAAPDPADPFQGRGVKLPNGQWVPNDHPLAQGTVATGGQPVAAGGQPAADPNPLGTAFKQALIQRIGATAAPTAIADDPVLAGQSGAFRQAQARASQRDRSAAMEQLGASGLESSGAASSAQRKIDQDRAMQEGSFDADLLGNARQERMQELQAFLSIAGNTLSNEERNALDRELAQLDAAVKREGIASTASLGKSDLDLRRELGLGGLNQNLLSILLNNRTENDRTGLTAAQMGLNANQQALIAMLGGG
jgi:hypothetical protein